MAKEKSEISKKVGRNFNYAAALVINMLYLALWAGLQVALYEVVVWLDIKDQLNKVVFITLRVIFAAGTIIPFLIALWEDTRIMWLQSNKRIRETV